MSHGFSKLNDFQRKEVLSNYAFEMAVYNFANENVIADASELIDLMRDSGNHDDLLYVFRSEKDDPYHPEINDYRFVSEDFAKRLISHDAAILKIGDNYVWGRNKDTSLVKDNEVVGGFLNMQRLEADELIRRIVPEAFVVKEKVHEKARSQGADSLLEM